jgi:ABC-type multidrug transport system ATPase subunit
MVHIQLQNISKRFNKNWLFNDIILEATNATKTAILGLNGSGKSTLLQIISGHVLPTEGKVIITINNKIIEPENVFRYIGFCAPAMELIEEFTLIEFLNTHNTFKKLLMPPLEIIDYLGLQKATDKKLSNFSSGMKQRVKLAQAIMIDEPLCFLDEPCTNLDDAGIALYHKMIEDFGAEKTIFVSSNMPVEYSFCTRQITINNN